MCVFCNASPHFPTHSFRHNHACSFPQDPKDFWADLMRVFDNAKLYNPPGSDCFLMAQTLQEVAQERFEKTIAPRMQVGHSRLCVCVLWSVRSVGFLRVMLAGGAQWPACVCVCSGVCVQ